VSTAWNISKDICALVGAASILSCAALVGWGIAGGIARKRQEKRIQAYEQLMKGSRLVPEPQRRRGR
jgi:hypothetical protein